MVVPESQTALGGQMLAAHSAYYRALSARRMYVDEAQAGRGPWGHEVSRGRHHRKVNLESTWRAIGKMCLDNGVQAADYVREAFSLLTDEGQAVSRPEDLAKPKFFELFLQLNKTTRQRLLDEWNMQAIEVKGSCERMKTTPEWLLRNPYQTYTPWFRVMYLKPYNQSIHELWGEHAVKCIQGDKALRNFLREHAPENYQALQDMSGTRFVD